MCPWSAVSACAGDSRNGFAAAEPFFGLEVGAAGLLGLAFGLLLSRSRPASGLKSWSTSSGVTRLLTRGVRSEALNGVSPDRFLGLGIGPEIMVERDVLLEDHDEVLDRRRGPHAVVVAVMVVGAGTRAGNRERKG